MPTRRKVRRTSSLPGLVSDDPTGLSLSGVAAAGISSLTSQSHLSSSTPSVPPLAYSFTFTTNLTPNTFQHADKASPSSSNDKSAAATSTSSTTLTSTNDASLPAAAASPANSTASNSRKRTADVLDEFYTDNIPSRANRSADQPASHSRKTAPGHIPRPPNAFILFRSDLVARKAVPTSLEADHSTISKIIGVCWRTLPARQRKRWEQKALEAKAAHKAQYPDYRYTPVHRKNGPTRKKAKKEQKKDDARCEELAQMLLSGSKGADLEARVRKLDESNPDNYQTTLSFGSRSNNNGVGVGTAIGPDGQPIPQQFTFVQGFPAGGHTIELPSAPPIHPPAYPSFGSNGAPPLFLQPRRHSSAPPADGAFMDNYNHHPQSSSSGASTPRTPARDLSAEGASSVSSFYGNGETTSPSTDSLVPLSRIARKLPTKSTHHLQPHHFFAEAQLTAAAEAAASGSGAGAGGVTGNGRKIKSSLSKAVRSRAQGFGAPQPASERDQLFIQSHWTNAAVSGVDPSVALLGGEKKRKKKGAYGAGGAGEIPREMIVPTWDLNAHQPPAMGGGEKEKSGESPALSSQALPAVPGFISADQYSPAFASGYVSADNKYNPFDAPPGSAHPGFEGTEGIGPFDMSGSFDEYGFAMAGDPLMGGIAAPDGMLGAQDIGGFGGFDFADRFETLGVDGNEDYAYHQPPYYSTVDIGSGPASADSTSPHSSDVDDAIAYSSGVPAPLHMAAQDPLGYSHPYQQQQMHAQVPMQQVTVHSHHVAHASSSSSSYLPLGPPTPLDAVGASATATGPIVYGANPDWSAFDNNAAVHGGVGVPVPLESIDPLEPLETMDASAPTAPAGYGYPPLPASAPPSECNSPTVVQLQRPSPHLQFRPPHVHAHGLAHGVGQHQRVQVPLTLNMQYTHPGGAPATPYGYPPSSATSPVTADIAEQMNAFSMAQTPQHQHQPLQQLPPGTPIKASPMVYHHPHHSHTQSMETFHGVVDQGDQWTEWTHPDPFHTGLVGDATGTNPGDGISTGV